MGLSHACPNARADNESQFQSSLPKGILIPDPSVELSFAQPGIIAEILVSEGEQVKEGQIIARLENSETLQAEVARAEEAYLTG